MQNTDERKKMVCPLTHPGLWCISGRREDFPKDEAGQAGKCRLWTHLYGKDPQTEKILDQFDCSWPWGVTTSVEGAQMTRQLTATLDAHRNEMRENFGEIAKAVTIGLRAVADRPLIVSPNHNLIEHSNGEGQENA